MFSNTAYTGSVSKWRTELWQSHMLNAEANSNVQSVYYIYNFDVVVANPVCLKTAGRLKTLQDVHHRPPQNTAGQHARSMGKRMDCPMMDGVLWCFRRSAVSCSGLCDSAACCVGLGWFYGVLRFLGRPLLIWQYLVHVIVQYYLKSRSRPLTRRWPVDLILIIVLLYVIYTSCQPLNSIGEYYWC